MSKQLLTAAESLARHIGTVALRHYRTMLEVETKSDGSPVTIADREAAGHGGTLNAAGDIYLSGFECLGACDMAPMASIDERYYGPLEQAEAETVIEQLRSGAEVVPEKAMARRSAAGGPEPEPDPRVAEVE